MRKISKKRAQQLKKYKEVRDNYLFEKIYCDKCGRQATEIHHKNGRNGARLLDVSYFMAVCRACHQYIHVNPIESRGKGWLI